MAEPKKISIKEFREQGYLQELNRQFLHPLGLALEVNLNFDGSESLGEVWDYRDDPEGMLYGPNMINPERASRIAEEWHFKELERGSRFGWMIQPAVGDAPPEPPGREVRVRDLEKGNVLLLGPDMQRTVKYCVPSSIDPVYLLGFEGSDDQIAKAPNDLVRIEEV